jgi:hypothetical protein
MRFEASSSSRRTRPRYDSGTERQPRLRNFPLHEAVVEVPPDVVRYLRKQRSDSGRETTDGGRDLHSRLVSVHLADSRSSRLSHPRRRTHHHRAAAATATRDGGDHGDGGISPTANQARILALREGAAAMKTLQARVPSRIHRPRPASAARRVRAAPAPRRAAAEGSVHGRNAPRRGPSHGHRRRSSAATRRRLVQSRSARSPSSSSLSRVIRNRPGAGRRTGPSPSPPRRDPSARR